MATKNRSKGKQKSQTEQADEAFALDENMNETLKQAPLQSQENEGKKGQGTPAQGGSPLAHGEEVEIKDDDSTKSYNNNKIATGNVILFSNLEIKDE